MKKLLPILLALIGTGAGVGAGFMLMPEPAPEEMVECLPPADGAETAEALPEEVTEDPAAENQYVKMTNQFVVPVVGKERVQALVVASLSLEISSGAPEDVFQREPKLRDVFLQVLLDHANLGGFTGNFTAGDRMASLRSALLEAARGVLGSMVRDVLITEIARQDG